MVMFWTITELGHVVFSKLLWPLRWSTWGRARLAFERRLDSTRLSADWAFEVSSEGEWEQTRPWAEELLKRGRRLEIIFSSESVEKGLLQWQERHPGHVRLLRLPLLAPTFGEVEKFLTAPLLVLCRYDFFPALMRAACARQSGLVWASLKNRRHRVNNPLWRGWYRFFFQSFDWVLPAVPTDAALFARIHRRVLPPTDLRVGQILARLDRGEATLCERFPRWEEFRARLQQTPTSQRWILGSFWESDLAIFADPAVKSRIADGTLMVMAVPHLLDPNWAARLRALGVAVHEITPGTQQLPTGPGVWLISIKGLLCELYAHAGRAYVGGGFGRSIHSVLEPFVAGAQVVVGPRVHRSTEFELVQAVESAALTVCQGPAELARALDKSDAPAKDTRALWAHNQGAQARELLDAVGGEGC